MLVADQADATRSRLAAAAREAQIPEIFVPRSVIHVAKIPILGTGKIDYVSVSRLATEQPQALAEVS